MARACIVEAVEGVAIQKKLYCRLARWQKCIAIGKGAGLGVHRRGRAAGAGVGAGACPGSADGHEARGRAGAGRAGARVAQGAGAGAGRRRQARARAGSGTAGRARQGAADVGTRGAGGGRAGRVAWALGARPRRLGWPGLCTRCTRPVFGPVRLGIFLSQIFWTLFVNPVHEHCSSRNFSKKKIFF